MATTYNHCQIAIVDARGNVSVIYPITQAQDVSVARTSNANLPTTATTVQKLANALGALAFKNVADIISTNGAATSTTKTWSSSVINTKLTELSSNITSLNNDLDAYNNVYKANLYTFIAESVSITVNANSRREYIFTANLSDDYNVISSIPMITDNGLGITIGRNASNVRTIYLWNNTSDTKDVGVIVVYIMHRKIFE